MKKTRPPVGWERAKNCFPVPNELLDFDLPAGAVAVYVYLLRHSDRKSNQFHPSESMIAKRLHLSRNTVAKHIRLLENQGLIVTENTEIITKQGIKKTATCSTPSSPCTKSGNRFTNGSSTNWNWQQNANRCKRNSLRKPARKCPVFAPVRCCVRPFGGGWSPSPCEGF